MGAKKAVVVSKAEYVNYLDGLIQAAGLNWQIWADQLCAQFAELTKEEADAIVDYYLTNYVEQQR